MRTHTPARGATAYLVWRRAANNSACARNLVRTAGRMATTLLAYVLEKGRWPIHRTQEAQSARKQAVFITRVGVRKRRVTQKMLNMKVDPTISMKTKHDDKLSGINKAKRVGFGQNLAMFTRPYNANVVNSWTLFLLVAPASCRQMPPRSRRSIVHPISGHYISRCIVAKREDVRAACTSRGGQPAPKAPATGVAGPGRQRIIPKFQAPR